MDTTQSGKQAGTGGSNPFDEIVLAEQAEEKRLKTEVEAMHAEERETQKALEEKEKAAEERFRAEAKKDLQTFASEGLEIFVQQGAVEAAAERAALEKAAAKNAPAALESLLSRALDPASYG